MQEQLPSRSLVRYARGDGAASPSLYIILCNCPLFTSLGSGPRIR